MSDPAVTAVRGEAARHDAEATRLSMELRALRQAYVDEDRLKLARLARMERRIREERQAAADARGMAAAIQAETRRAAA